MVQIIEFSKYSGAGSGVHKKLRRKFVDTFARFASQTNQQFLRKLTRNSSQSCMRWSHTEEQQLLCLLQSKMSISEIAVTHGRSKSSITSRIAHVAAKGTTQQRRLLKRLGFPKSSVNASNRDLAKRRRRAELK